MESPPAAPSLELHRLARATSIGFLVILFAASAHTIRLAFGIPKFKGIFEDMLGSADKVPGLTKILMNNHAILLWIALAIPLIGVLIVLRLPPARTIIPITVSIAVAFLLGEVVSLGLNAPLTKILSGITGM